MLNIYPFLGNEMKKFLMGSNIFWAPWGMKTVLRPHVPQLLLNFNNCYVRSLFLFFPLLVTNNWYTLYNKWFKFYHLFYIGRVFFFHLLTQKKSFDIFSNLPVIKWFKAIIFAQMHIFPFVSSLTNTKDCDVRFRTFFQFILWRSRHRKS